MILKKMLIGCTIVFLLVVSLSLCGGEEKSPVLKGPYMGQEKPGLTPRIFAPGVITTKAYEFPGTFSPDGNEFYFTRGVRRKIGEKVYDINTILVTRRIDDVWTKPEPTSFSGTYFDFEPHISPDGKKLYFGTTRPLEKGKRSGDLHEWVAERTQTGWAAPKLLGSPFADIFVMYISQSNENTIYFTGEDGILKSRYSGGKYQKPEKLSDAVHYLKKPAHPCIARDESYLIFDAGHAKPENPDLYICFRKKDGTWTKAKSMGDAFNTGGEDMCACVSPDGKYLFFTRDGDIYWVDAKIIDTYRE